MERAWLYGTMIYNINTGKDCSIVEVREMDRLQLLNSITETRKKRKEDSREQAPGGTSKLSDDIQVSQSVIWSAIQLLKTPDTIQKAVEKDKIKQSTAIEAQKLKDDQAREELYRTLIDDAQKVDDEEKTFRSHKEVRKVVSFINEPEEKVLEVKEGELDILSLFVAEDIAEDKKIEAKEELKKLYSNNHLINLTTLIGGK